MTYRAKVGKCVVEIVPVLSVRIRGEERDEDDVAETDLGPLPICPDDGGLIVEFMDWLRETRTSQLRLGSTAGGGIYSAFFALGHEARFVKWFEKRAEEGS